MVDLSKPQHFTKEQSEWIKAYVSQKNKEFYDKALDDLFNTPYAINGMTLKEVYEEDASNNFDIGWDECYECFEQIAEQLKAGDQNEN